MRHFIPDLELLLEPCCPDVHRKVCYACRALVHVKLQLLAHNIAIAGALCKAFDDGIAFWEGPALVSHRQWRPGCFLKPLKP